MGKSKAPCDGKTRPIAGGQAFIPAKDANRTGLICDRAGKIADDRTPETIIGEHCTLEEQCGQPRRRIFRTVSSLRTQLGMAEFYA